MHRLKFVVILNLKCYVVQICLLKLTQRSSCGFRSSTLGEGQGSLSLHCLDRIFKKQELTHPCCLCSAKLVIRWVDITQLEKNGALLLPDVIKVSTRSSEHFFSVFLNINETFKLMEQLANIAMRQLLDNEGFEQDRSLPKLKKKSPKKVSALKR